MGKGCLIIIAHSACSHEVLHLNIKSLEIFKRESKIAVGVHSCGLGRLQGLQGSLVDPSSRYSCVAGGEQAGGNGNISTKPSCWKSWALPSSVNHVTGNLSWDIILRVRWRKRKQYSLFLRYSLTKCVTEEELSVKRMSLELPVLYLESNCWPDLKALPTGTTGQLACSAPWAQHHHSAAQPVRKYPRSEKKGN